MRVIGFDVETFLIAPGVAAPKLVCGSYDDDDFEIGVETAEDYLERFIGWIADPEVILTAHNLPFDLIVCIAEVYERDGNDAGQKLLRAVFATIKAGRLRCTKTREKILENAKGELKMDWDEDLEQWKRSSFTLARCMWTRCQIFVKKDDTWRMSYGLLDGVPLSKYPKEAIEYSLLDSTYGRQLFFAQEEAALAEGCKRRPDGLADIPGEIATTLTDFCLGLMRTWGVRTDLEATEIVEAEFRKKYEAAVALGRKWNLVGKKKETEILPEFLEQYAWVTKKEDLKKVPKEHKHRVEKPKRIMKKIRDRVRFIYTSRGQAVPMAWDSKRRCQGKNIATDRETLTFKRHPTWEQDEALSAVADLARYEKLLTTYVPILKRGARWPITPDWNAMVETFRTSCSNPNLQNMPRGSAEHGDNLVRQCFVPRDGSTFDFCDYDTLEMRTLGQLMIDLRFSRALANAFKDGKDPHVIMTAEMLGLSYDVANDRYKAGDKVLEDARQGNKITNYGCGGGMGPDALRDYARGYGHDIDPSLARRLHGNFRATWGMEDYFNHCSTLCGDGGEAEKVVHPRTKYVRGRVRYTALCNHGFQHTAAVGAKAALCRVVEESLVDESSPVYGCRVWYFGHDEVGMENPYSGKRGSNASDHLRRIMIEEMSVLCPDVPIGATVVKCRRWYKGAKPVRIDGVLVPSVKRDGKWVADLDEEQSHAAA